MQYIGQIPLQTGDSVARALGAASSGPWRRIRSKLTPLREAGTIPCRMKTHLRLSSTTRSCRSVRRVCTDKMFWHHEQQMQNNRFPWSRLMNLRPSSTWLVISCEDRLWGVCSSSAHTCNETAASCPSAHKTHPTPEWLASVKMQQSIRQSHWQGRH